MARRAAKLSIALALALAAVNGAPALAQSDGAASGDALQDARQAMPKYGGRGDGYGRYDFRLRARYDYGLDGSTSSKAAEGAMKKAAAHKHTAACRHSWHGLSPGVAASGGIITEGRPPKKKYAHAKPGATRTAPNNSGEKKPPANKSTPPKKPAPSGEKMTQVPQPPVILTGKKGARGRLDISPDPKGVDYETAGAKGGFSEAAGLELEVQPIEYRDGISSEYHKTKQPGLPKYTNIHISPLPHNDGFAKELLREARFQVELEDLKTRHFPERQRQSAQPRSDAALSGALKYAKSTLYFKVKLLEASYE